MTHLLLHKTPNSVSSEPGAAHNSVSSEPGAAQAHLLERKLVAKLGDLVCALDVPVRFSFLDQDRVDLNSPLIYEKDLDTVWALVSRDQWVESEHQKKMLAPMGVPPCRIYGYCGLNISSAILSTLKSVGGFVIKDMYGRIEPVVGIAEYKVAAANREPGELAAPKDVIASWAVDQIKRVLREPLSDEERETAAKNLGSIINDIRPIFFTTTSEGGLNLDECIVALQRNKSALLPVIGYKFAELYQYQFSLPRIRNEFQLGPSDIEFFQFTICPKPHSLMAIRKDTSGAIHIDVAPKIYNDPWSVIINTLRDADVNFTLTYLQDHRIGTYSGLDSPRHGLKQGDDVMGDAIQLSLGDS